MDVTPHLRAVVPALAGLPVLLVIMHPKGRAKITIAHNERKWYLLTNVREREKRCLLTNEN